MKGYGITLAPRGVSYASFVQLAREAEDAGFGGVFIPEALNDALLCSLSVANATKRIAIATWIV
ncbi:MAG TPA: LLM class flavin-dependent oxidoreductase, partial [Candidatus Binataceae bacterium]|nr:LLM class flavin-dependent oxidoreductase [Candidatus Binataceae bacterium]